MGNQTALYTVHTDAGARMVDFGGWDMPVHYGSQIEEHHSVRNDAGLFDVSHMTIVDLTGAGCRTYLERLLANNIARAMPAGKALYTCMLNDNGGIIDDHIDVCMRVDDAADEAPGSVFIEKIEMLEKDPPGEVSLQSRDDLLTTISVAIADNNQASFLKKARCRRRPYRPGTPCDDNDFVL